MLSSITNQDKIEEKKEEKSYAEQFNDVIKKMFNIYKDLPSPGFKSKLHINEMQSKMVQGMNAEEGYALSVLGPHLWDAQVNIISKNDTYFINRRYELELQSLCSKHMVNYDNAINTVGYMKEAYKSVTKEKQTELFGYVSQLLILYIKHLKSLKDKYAK